MDRPRLILEWNCHTRKNPMVDYGITRNHVGRDSKALEKVIRTSQAFGTRSFQITIPSQTKSDSTDIFPTEPRWSPRVERSKPVCLGMTYTNTSSVKTTLTSYWKPKHVGIILKSSMQVWDLQSVHIWGLSYPKKVTLNEAPSTFPLTHLTYQLAILRDHIAALVSPILTCFFLFFCSAGEQN